jgi:hypothetical protein
MGIRFNTNTWRSPLLLIDSWLPATPQRNATLRALPQVVRRFARAGWLGRAIEAPPVVAPCLASHIRPPAPPASLRACRVRVLRTVEAANNSRIDARLVISGRISDVCAELDRLAAQEHQISAMQA